MVRKEEEEEGGEEEETEKKNKEKRRKHESERVRNKGLLDEKRRKHESERVRNEGLPNGPSSSLTKLIKLHHWIGSFFFLGSVPHSSVSFAETFLSLLSFSCFFFFFFFCFSTLYFI